MFNSLLVRWCGIDTTDILDFAGKGWGMEREEAMMRRFPRLLGGQLSLDYVNTPDPRGDNPQEYLLAYGDLVGWARFAGVLSGEEEARLLRVAEGEPGRAAAVYARAIEVREAMHRVFLAIAEGEEPGRGDLGAIEGAYQEALGHARLVAGVGGFDWGWVGDEGTLDRPLWPIARAGVELLTSPGVARVKVCGNHGCGWLFLDTSKNGSRRWCSMEGCGSQVKMRRYYARKRAGAGRES
jgi:predicted RNA-binding Zn ribbon-like protein